MRKSYIYIIDARFGINISADYQWHDQLPDAANEYEIALPGPLLPEHILGYREVLLREILVDGYGDTSYQTQLGDIIFNPRFQDLSATTLVDQIDSRFYEANPALGIYTINHDGISFRTSYSGTSREEIQSYKRPSDKTQQITCDGRVLSRQDYLQMRPFDASDYQSGHTNEHSNLFWLNVLLRFIGSKGKFSAKLSTEYSLDAFLIITIYINLPKVMQSLKTLNIPYRLFSTPHHKLLQVPGINVSAADKPTPDAMSSGDQLRSLSQNISRLALSS